MNQRSEWIAAYDALQQLVAAGFEPGMAKQTICERAHAGLIRAKAELFISDDEERSDHEIPKIFWWAKGRAALEQNWKAGDFSTWLKNQHHLQAFGVSFATTDFQKLQPISDAGGGNEGSTAEDLRIGEKYIAVGRIEQLQNSDTSEWDTRKLVRLCQELNSAHAAANYISTALLVRSIIDHVPPIFGQKDFKNMAAHHGTKSFKASMSHLQDSMRKIADSFLHEQIRTRETLPNANTVEVRRDLDVLLGEVVRKL